MRFLLPIGSRPQCPGGTWDSHWMLRPSPPFDNIWSLVLVWTLRGNIIRTVLYIANVLPLPRTQLTAKNSYSLVGSWVCLCVFLVCMIYLYVHVCFVLPWSVESCFGVGVTNLNEPPSSFLVSPCCCGLGAGSIPLRAIVNRSNARQQGYLCHWSSSTE